MTAKSLVNHPARDAAHRQVQFDHGGRRRIFENDNAGPAERFIGIGQQWRENIEVHVGRGGAGRDGGTDATEPAVAAETAMVLGAPEVKIR